MEPVYCLVCEIDWSHAQPPSCPVWKTCTRSWPRTSMVFGTLVTETWPDGPNKVKAGCRLFTHRCPTSEELALNCCLCLWDYLSGVLLLNAVLTVRAHQANSHKDRGWENFTDAVVQWLSHNQEGLVFMLWGSYAQKKGAAINRVGCVCVCVLIQSSQQALNRGFPSVWLQKRHHVLQAVHPSPLSAHRGFFGCRHFSKANELLEKSGKSPIDWKAL